MRLLNDYRIKYWFSKIAKHSPCLGYSSVGPCHPNLGYKLSGYQGSSQQSFSFCNICKPLRNSSVAVYPLFALPEFFAATGWSLLITHTVSCISPPNPCP